MLVKDCNGFLSELASQTLKAALARFIQHSQTEWGNELFNLESVMT